MFLDETAFDVEDNDYGRGPPLKSGGQFEASKSRNGFFCFI